MRLWFVALFDLLTKVAWFVCVTYAACYFGKWWIIFFVFAVVFMGHSFESTYPAKKKSEGNSDD